MRKFAMFIATLLCLLAVGSVIYRGWAQTATPQTAAKTVDERVRAIVVEHLGVGADKVTPGARFKEELKADDLDMTELVMAFEQEFGFEIKDYEAAKMTRVGDVIRFIRSKSK